MIQLVLIVLSKRKEWWQKMSTNISIVLTKVSVPVENR
jgi:hypothetical protein